MQSRAIIEKIVSDFNPADPSASLTFMFRKKDIAHDSKQEYPSVSEEVVKDTLLKHGINALHEPVFLIEPNAIPDFFTNMYYVEKQCKSRNYGEDRRIVAIDPHPMQYIIKCKGEDAAIKYLEKYAYVHTQHKNIYFIFISDMKQSELAQMTELAYSFCDAYWHIPNLPHSQGLLGEKINAFKNKKNVEIEKDYNYWRGDIAYIEQLEIERKSLRDRLTSASLQP